MRGYRRCEQCGAQFRVRMRTAKYWGAECRTHAHNHRQRERTAYFRNASLDASRTDALASAMNRR